mmetsp:Transcript_14483/g.35036  ORF Transcript_14483/g.35036 Transcript_14483/m.35036 type:complete len:219 (+) Transcript_14483:1393-2049(+)
MRVRGAVQEPLARQDVREHPRRFGARVPCTLQELHAELGVCAGRGARGRAGIGEWDLCYAGHAVSFRVHAGSQRARFQRKPPETRLRLAARQQPRRTRLRGVPGVRVHVPRVHAARAHHRGLPLEGPRQPPRVFQWRAGGQGRRSLLVSDHAGRHRGVPHGGERGRGKPEDFLDVCVRCWEAEPAACLRSGPHIAVSGHPHGRDVQAAGQVHGHAAHP